MVVLVLLAVIVVPLLIGGADAVSMALYIPTSWFLALIILMVVLTVINVARLATLLGSDGDRIGTAGMYRLYLIVELFSKITPAGAGALPVALALLRPYGVDAAKVSGVFLVSAVLDGLSLVLVFLVVGAFGVASILDISPFSPIWMAGACLGFVLVFFAVRAICPVIAQSPESGRIPVGWRGSLVSFFRRLMHHINAIDAARLAFAMMLSILYWLVHLSLLYGVVWAFGEALGWGRAMAIQFLAMGLGHISFSPGGAGVVELSVLSALALSMPLATASAVVLVWRSLMLYFYLVLGALALIVERVKRSGTMGAG